MENATKALIIAGTILISIIILTIAVGVFSHFSSFSYNYDQKMIAQQRAEFNDKFAKYSGANITAQDVRTIVNLAQEYNSKYNYDVISVKSNIRGLDEFDTDDWNDFLEESNPTANSDQVMYTCVISLDEVAENNGFFKEITITK